MKPKEARCRFNSARSVYHHFNPICTYIAELNIKFPPHVRFAMEHATPRTCRLCKCFEEANDE